MPTGAVAANEEQDGRCCILRTLLHDIGADRFERHRLMQVDDAFGAGLATHSTRMIETNPDRYAPPAIGNVGQMQAENLSWAKTAIKQQTDDRQIATAPELGQQPVHRLVRHRARYAMNLPQPHRATRWHSLHDAAQEWAMVV